MTAQQTRLMGKRVAVLATDGVEEIEYTESRAAVERAGATVELISIKRDPIQSMRHDIEMSDTYPVDKVVTGANPGEYDALVLPGGAVNPDRLRINPYAVRFVRAFFDQMKPVAAICHGPWLLAEADVVKGRRVTSYASLRTDLANAGAIWVDEEVCVDSGLVTSRGPADLPSFCTRMIEEIAEGRHVGQMAPA